MPYDGKYIAVDFDGTCVDHRYPNIGADVPYCVDVLRLLSAAGKKLILNTMRSGKELQDAVDWFTYKAIPLYGVNHNPDQDSWTKSPKVYAEIYIDDAAYGCPLVERAAFRRPFVDWYEVAKDLLGYVKPEWTPQQGSLI